MAPEKPQHETYIISKRSPEEVQRLNWQHDYIRRNMDGNLIVPDIPFDQIHSIADIGCGTGVWLQSVAADRTLQATADGLARSYHGFDISSTMFPPEAERNGITFSTLDVLQPIPEEWKEKFDFVAVRLLTLAIKAVDLGKALNNVVSLIKPGGYLQWIEVAKAQAQDLSKYPIIRTANDRIDAFWKGAGFMFDPMKVIMEHVSSSGLASAKCLNYLWTSEPVIEDSMAFCMETWRVLWPQLLLRTGEVETWDEAMQKTEELVVHLKEVPVKEVLADGHWSCMVARKKS